MIRIAVLLGGCGHRDGAEIQEAVMTLLGLDEAGAEVRCLSRDKIQAKVVNHLTGLVTGEERNVLVESARIARGAVVDVAEADPAGLDGIVVVGGFGAALNLCDFASKGDAMQVDGEVARLLLSMHEAGKPIGAVCIAPVILARLFGPKKARLTIGDDPATAAAVERMGAVHVACGSADCVVDEANRLVTTPAYMLAKSVKELKGIWKLALEVVRLAASEARLKPGNKF